MSKMSRTGMVFVGRQTYLQRLAQLFRMNTTRAGQRLKIISIYGKSGVGKSFLIDQVLREVQPSSQQLVLRINRVSITSLPQVLRQVMDNANARKKEFKNISSLINAIRAIDKKFLQKVQKRNIKLQQAISDLGVVGIKWSLRRYHLTPDILGIEIPDEDIRLLVEYAQEHTAGLIDRVFKTRRFRADMDLSLIAGDCLWEDVNRILSYKGHIKKVPNFLPLRSLPDRKSLLFIIDDYEGLQPFMEETLLRLAGKLQNASFNSLLVFVGRNELGWATAWRHFSSVKEESIFLDVFTDKEAREYLGLRGIRKADAVNDILSKSHKLPLLLDVLSDAHLHGRMAKWVEDYFQRITYHMNKKQKQWLEMLCFVDGRIDEDIIAYLVNDRGEAPEIFEWFKQEGTAHISTERGWEIDPLVRSLVREKVRQDSLVRAREYERQAREAVEEMKRLLSSV